MFFANKHLNILRTLCDFKNKGKGFCLSLVKTIMLHNQYQNTAAKYCMLLIAKVNLRPNPTAWKWSKCGVFSGTNTGKYGPKITPYLDIFHAVASFSAMQLRIVLVHRDKDVFRILSNIYDRTFLQK